MNKKLILIVLTIFITNLFSQKKGLYKDKRDDNTYSIVEIGNQVWMTENIRYKTKTSVYYKNDSLKNKKDGRLYSFNEAYKACPSGWHLPNADEAISFEQNIFALELNKAGFVNHKSKFKDKTKKGFYWTSTPTSVDKAYSYLYERSNIKKIEEWKDYKYSVRCVADKADLDFYNISVTNENRYTNKTKLELNKLLEKAIAKEDYDEASIIKNEIAKKTISEKYANKTNNELKSLIKIAISSENYEKAEEIQSIIDKRKNLSPDLTKVELLMLQKEAIAVENYERAEKIKTLLEEKNLNKVSAKNSIENVHLSKYVGKKYGKTQIYYLMGFKSATGRLGKTINESGWNGNYGSGITIGLKIPAFRNFFKNRKGFVGGFDIAFNTSGVSLGYTFSDKWIPFMFPPPINFIGAIEFDNDSYLMTFGLSGGSFFDYKVPNSQLSFGFYYRLGLSFISYDYNYHKTSYYNYPSTGRAKSIAFRKYFGFHLQFGKILTNVGFEWGRTFNTTIKTNNNIYFNDENIPTGMLDLSIGLIF